MVLLGLALALTVSGNARLSMSGTMKMQPFSMMTGLDRSSSAIMCASILLETVYRLPGRKLARTR